MNVRSAAGKIDDIIAMKRDQSIDVLCLCETWHDEDSWSAYDACARKACAEVLERARPRSVSELSTLSTNHGGVAIAAPRGILLTAIIIIVPATRRSTVGDSAFAVAAPRAWNSLPDAIRRSPSLAVFQTFTKNSLLYPVFLLSPRKLSRGIM